MSQFLAMRWPETASKPIISLMLTLFLCQQVTSAQAEPVRGASEIDRIMGKDARTLIQMFGPPVQDVREAAARKLQFATPDCILDAYLYAPADGMDAVVTYVATRIPNGRDAERNSCISALRLRR